MTHETSNFSRIIKNSLEICDLVFFPIHMKVHLKPSTTLKLILGDSYLIFKNQTGGKS